VQILITFFLDKKSNKKYSDCVAQLAIYLNWRRDEGAGDFPQFNFVNHFFLAKNLLIVLNDSFVFIGVTHTAQCLRIKEVSWSCYLFVPKVISRIMFLNADFGQGNDQQQAVSASKSAVLSLSLSWHKQRKLDRL